MKTLDPILMTNFGCMFCSANLNIRLTSHLKKSPDCMRRYFERFKVSSVEVLLKLIENLKRKMRISRSRASRNLENQRQKERKKMINSEPKSQAELINLFRRDTEFSNAKLCYFCQKNVSRGETVEYEELKKQPNFDPSQAIKFRRFQAYFRCKSCSDKDKLDTEAKNLLSVLNEDESTLILPSEFVPNHETSTSESFCQTTLRVTCMFPATSEALDVLNIPGVKSRSNDAAVMYKFDPDIKDIVSIAYENEYWKFKMAKMFSDRFQGVIKEGQDNLLSSIEKVSSEHRIVGSESWLRNEKDLNIHRLDQFGAICFSVHIELPVQEDTLATCLIQSGIVVSVLYEGESTSEQQKKYLVHNHSTDQDCDITCQKQELSQYLPGVLDMSTINTKFLATHLSSIQMKLSSFVRHYLKDPSSDIFTEAYSIRLVYEKDGSIHVKGYIWPKQLDDLNINIAKFPSVPLNSDLMEQSLKFIDSVISTSSDVSTIASQFEMSTFESQKLAAMVKKHQFHHCIDRPCRECESVRLPALETGFLQTPDLGFTQNIPSAFKFRSLMSHKLKSTCEAQIRSLTVKQWLRNIFFSFDGNITEENGKRIWSIDTGTDKICFLIDKRLLDLTGKYPDDPDLALYQYCLTCSSLENSFQVVIKTVMLCDSYTRPYHKSLLKAFNSKIEVIPVNGYNEEKKCDERICNYRDIDGVNESFKMTHREVSLGEAFSSLDKNMHRTFNSTSSEFICAYKERKVYFKKANAESETTFMLEGKNVFYERQRSNIDKYFDRINGAFVTLYEFCSIYDYLGREESRQVLKLFSKNPDLKIKESEFSSGFDPSTKLPELILTSKNEVMKIRSEKKTVSYPKFDEGSDQDLYSKVLMFYPLPNEASRAEEVKELFNRTDNDGDLENNGIAIVERIERYDFI